MPQMVLPIFQEGTTAITSLVGYKKQDGTVYYFLGQLPLFSHLESDTASFRFLVSQLVINGHVKQMDIVRAFGVSKISMKRNIAQMNETGPGSFFNKVQRRRGATVLTKKTIEKIENELANGKSEQKICDELNIKLCTLKKGLQHGRIKKKSKGQPE